MKTLCIVPFTSKEFPLLPHLMSSYDNVIFLSPKGIGTDKEDIAMMQNLEPLGFKFCNSIKGSIEIADDVLVSNINVEDVALYNFAYDALECAVKKGKKVTLKPVVTPFTSKQKVTYTSSNKKVATVSAKGVVTGKKKGTAKITIKSGSKSVKVTVRVK